MAASPFPFFFPTTGPAYVPTTVVPPPPFGCGAPAYAPCSFSPAAAYPPAPFSGGYSTSPFPFFYSAPPPFPHADTYRCRPPTSAYTPASGFSPNWPTWPPPSPDPTAQNRERHPSQSNASSTSVTTSTSHADPSCSKAACVPVDNEVGTYLAYDGDYPSSPTTGNRMHQDRVPEGLNDLASQLKLAHRSLLDIKRRLGEHQAQSQSLCDSLQGDLSKMRNRTGAATSSSASSLSSPLDASATAYVAPQVFGEKPTPRYLHGGSTNLSEQNLDAMPVCYGLQNLNRHGQLRADGTEHSYFTLPSDYPPEQAVPEPVFDVYDDESDGCSNEIVDVFGTPEQQKYEEEQLESNQFAKFFDKASENAFSEETPERVSNVYDVDTKGCTDEFVAVFDSIFVQHTDEDTKSSKSLEELLSAQLPKCFSKAPANVQQLRDPPLNVLVTHERRK